MAYTPQNVNVFIAAFSGAMTGIGAGGKIPSDPNSADYATLATMVGAYAKVFDANWGTRSTNSLDLQLIEDMSEGVWFERTPVLADPVFQLPSTYSSEVLAMIAMIVAAEAYMTAQGITPPSGGVSPAPGALAAPDWYLDPLNSTGLASASNNGTTPTTPLLTMAQVLSKFGLGNVIDNVTDLVTFHYLSVPTNLDDRFDLSVGNVTLGRGMSVRIEAPAATLVRTTVLTAVTAINRAYGTAAQLTIDDGGGAFVKGQRATIVGGPRDGAKGWITQTVAGPAPTTSFALPYDIATSTITTVTPQVGDTIHLETLPSLPVAEILTHCEGGSLLNKAMLFSNFNLNPGAKLAVRSTITSLACVLDGCTLTTVLEGSGDLTIANCFTNSGANLSFNGQSLNIQSGYYGDLTFARSGTSIIFDQDCVVGAPLTGIGIGSAFKFGNVGFFNITGSAITLDEGATAQVGTGGAFPGAGAPYGGPQGAGTISGFGLLARPGAQLVYAAASLPALQGDTGDWKLPTATPYFLDETTTPGTGIWTQATAGTPNTWANLAAAQPGGFGTGNAHDPVSNAHILKV